jgi:hypothetical protein
MNYMYRDSHAKPMLGCVLILMVRCHGKASHAVGHFNCCCCKEPQLQACAEWCAAESDAVGDETSPARHTWYGSAVKCTLGTKCRTPNPWLPHWCSG